MIRKNKPKKMSLTLDELKLLFEVLLRDLKDSEINEIAFADKDDYYCKIWHKDRNFDDGKFLDCPPYTIGSLDDDISSLKGVISGENPLFGLDIERLGAILTALGATIELKYCN